MKRMDVPSPYRVQSKMLKIFMHGYSSADQADVQALLLELVVERHGWVLDQTSSVVAGYHLRFELALFDIVEVYAALQQTGVRFTPLTHRALTEMCLCQKHLANHKDIQIVTVDLRVMTQKDQGRHFERFVPANAV